MTYIYFGIVNKYFPERGYGFLTHPISLGPSKDVFFHVRSLEKFDSAIVEELSRYNYKSNICFWYITEKSEKGQQLSRVLTSEDVFNLNHANPDEFIEKIESLYENIARPLPFWLDQVSTGLIGHAGKEKLTSKRRDLIDKRNKELELQKIEALRLKKIKEEKLKIEKERLEQIRKRAEEESRLQQEAEEKQRIIEEEEFNQLVAEMKSKGFTQSGQVSNYIIRNRLGEKYKHISGILKMGNDYSTWNFDGGFPPHIYARLCHKLNLGNKGTRSRVLDFTSFNDLK